MPSHASYPSARRYLALWSFVLACGPSPQDERCEDVSAQIEQALEDNIAKGVLVGTAVGCELTPESFNPRVDPADVDYLSNAFQNACAIQAQECSGIPRHPIPPPSAPPPAPNLPPPSPSTSPQRAALQPAD